jgi:hypothetical protein
LEQKVEDSLINQLKQTVDSLTLRIQNFEATQRNSYHILQLENNWINFSELYAPATVSKQGNLVIVSGHIRLKGQASEIITTLPEGKGYPNYIDLLGYRPEKSLIFLCFHANTYVRVDVLPDGSIEVPFGTNNWMSLNCITFMAAQQVTH